MHKEAQPIATLSKPNGNLAVNVSAATINQSNEVTSFLQIVPVSKQSGGNRLNTYAFLDSKSTVSLIDQSVQEKLRAQSTDVTLNIAGIHGTKYLKTERVPLKINGLHSKVHSIEAFAHPSISLGNKNYKYNQLKQRFNHLSVLPNKSFNLMEVGIILGQDALLATQAVNDSESNNNNPTDNPVAQTVQNGATASGQETENVLETFSAKQMREERMKNFDIEFETKMRLEQARF